MNTRNDGIPQRTHRLCSLESNNKNNLDLIPLYGGAPGIPSKGLTVAVLSSAGDVSHPLRLPSVAK